MLKRVEFLKLMRLPLLYGESTPPIKEQYARQQADMFKRYGIDFIDIGTHQDYLMPLSTSSESGGTFLPDIGRESAKIY